MPTRRGAVPGRAGPARWFARGKELAHRLLDTVPPVRRSVEELVRIEVIDRSMAIGAQALLALVPLAIVLAAFSPHLLTAAGVHRIADVTGLGKVGDEIARGSGVADLEVTPSPSQVRSTTGGVGLLITVFSASSFGRAVQRLYQRVWEQPHLGGLAGLRRALAWLVVWILSMQLIALLTHVLDPIVPERLDPLLWTARALLASAVWWWSMRLLLARRVPWAELAVPALATGISLAVYTTGSGVVMPTYVRAGAQQFGTLGVVLAVATWLVGYAGIMVVAATLGRVVTEDPMLRSTVARLRRDLGLPGPRAQEPARDRDDEAVAEQPGRGQDDEQVQ